MSANSAEGMHLFSLPEMTPMQKPLGPPPLNYATHPKRLACSRAKSAPSHSADQSTVSDSTTASTTPLKASVDPTTSSPNRVNADNAASLDGLADSFHHLSIAGSSQIIQPRPFASPTFAKTYHYATPKKYYSVTVGRRTGVFFPWYVLSFNFLLFR